MLIRLYKLNVAKKKSEIIKNFKNTEELNEYLSKENIDLGYINFSGEMYYSRVTFDNEV